MVNEAKVKYFDLLEYVSKIKLTDKVLLHLDDTSSNFEQYIKTLAKICNYSDYAALYYWLDQNYHELVASGKIENKKVSNIELFKSDLFFESLNINHERIKAIHRFVCEHTSVGKNVLVGQYRTKEASVGYVCDGQYKPYWYAAEPQDIKRFMDSFLVFYKTSSLKEIYANPFLKSSLAHLLFIRIHPFGDGNGRTARIIQNIYLNQLTYVNRLDNIYFDLEHDSNEQINDWFDFILNMYDEQLFYQTNRLPSLKEGFDRLRKFESSDLQMAKIAEKSQIKKTF